jgi:hypothetical protein
MTTEQADTAGWSEEAAVARLLADPDVRRFLAAMAKAVREAASAGASPGDEVAGDEAGGNGDNPGVAAVAAAPH